MNVRQLRTALFNIVDQDVEVRFDDGSFCASATTVLGKDDQKRYVLLSRKKPEELPHGTV